MYEVLIVEDDPMVAMITKQYIGQNPHFHTAAICHDGASALQYIQSNLVHLIILDVYMPRLDGMALLRKIREKNLPISVIMVTAANSSTTVEEAFRLGAMDYLIKPFMNERFQQALEKFLVRQSALHDISVFNQQNIDDAFYKGASADLSALPKGIQEVTLLKICHFLDAHPSESLTNEEIADHVELSRVTVRRYMSYLVESGKVVSTINYDTGGRPSLIYQYVTPPKKQ